MIQVVAYEVVRLVSIRLSGLHRASDFAELARSFSTRFPEREGLYVLFDWSALSVWDNDSAAREACKKWESAVPPIHRAAIVHPQRWMRHAAVLSAVLRVKGVEVRSWSVCPETASRTAGVLTTSNMTHIKACLDALQVF